MKRAIIKSEPFLTRELIEKIENVLILGSISDIYENFDELRYNSILIDIVENTDESCGLRVVSIPDDAYYYIHVDFTGRETLFFSMSPIIKA